MFEFGRCAEIWNAVYPEYVKVTIASTLVVFAILTAAKQILLVIKRSSIQLNSRSIGEFLVL